MFSINILNKNITTIIHTALFTNRCKQITQMSRHVKLTHQQNKPHNVNVWYNSVTCLNDKSTPISLIFIGKN